MKELAGTVIPDLQAAQHRVHSQIEFSKVVLSTDTLADNKLMLLEGWIPTERVAEMTEYLRSQEVYYETAAPVPGDDVPILWRIKASSGCLSRLCGCICCRSTTNWT